MGKKRFRSYAEAEEAYIKAETERCLLMRAVMALYKGRAGKVQESPIHWRPWISGGKGNKYRVGLFDLDSPGGPKLIEVFDSKTNQGASLYVYDAYEYCNRVIERAGRAPGIDKDAVALHQAASEALQYLHAYEKQGHQLQPTDE